MTRHQTYRPDFSVQSAEIMDHWELHEWFRKTGYEMKDKGATWWQYSQNPNHEPPIYLVEGWLVRPVVQPAPHFHLVPS